MTMLTIDGCPFDPDLPLWRVRTPTRKVLFDFSSLALGPEMLLDLRRALAGLLLRQAPETAYETLSCCRVLARRAAVRRGGPIGAFELEDFEDYRRSLDANRLHRAARMLRALKRLDEAGFASLAADLRRELPHLFVAKLRPPAPARIACPRRGPLTLRELAAAAAALRDAPATGQVTPANRALCMLALRLQPRPGQAALIKVGDLLGTDVGGVPLSLTMPLIKGRRTGTPPPRAPARRLHPELAEALGGQRDRAIAWGAARGIAPDDCPLFPSGSKWWLEAGGGQLAWAAGHSTSGGIVQRIAETFAALDLSAMRATADERRVLANRLRRSVATSARSAGATFGQVSQLLWQRDRSTAAIYTGPSVGVIERVERAVDFRPLAELYRRELEAGDSRGGRHALEE